MEYLLHQWWMYAGAGVFVGFCVGVWAAGRILVPLYHSRIHFLERQLHERHVDVEPSV